MGSSVANLLSPPLEPLPLCASSHRHVLANLVRLLLLRQQRELERKPDMSLSYVRAVLGTFTVRQKAEFYRLAKERLDRVHRKSSKKPTQRSSKNKRVLAAG